MTFQSILMRGCQLASVAALAWVFAQWLSPMLQGPIPEGPLFALLMLTALAMRVTWLIVERAFQGVLEHDDACVPSLPWDFTVREFSSLMEQHAEGEIHQRADESLPAPFAQLAISYNRLLDRHQQSLEDLHAHRCDLLETRASLEEHAADLELHAERLRLAQIAANQANAAKSMFLANMSHEIRTPMTAILGFAEVLLDDDEDPLTTDQRAAVETVLRNGQHLLSLINDLLDLSKIEAGRLEVERIDCDPWYVAQEAAELIEPKARAKELQFQIEREGTLPQRICSDPTRLRQILVNLLSNAVKFTERGQVRLVLRIKQTRPQHPMLELEVTDSGIGMTEEQLGRIFKPFTQGDASTTRKFGGTGLGLTISRYLAQQLGGDIVVESKSGVGSTFRATVETGPLDETVRELSQFLQPSGGSPFESMASSLAGCRVLVADDNVDLRQLVCHKLEQGGAEVEAVGDGESAVAAVVKAQQLGRPYTAVLLDMQMPAIDGYAATRRLRDEGIRCPIIALTAHAMSGDREKCLAAGCDEFVAKPVRQELLIAVVSRCVATSRTVPSDQLHAY